MATLNRFKNCGAVFADTLGDSVPEMQLKGWTITGSPKVVETPFGHGTEFDGSTDIINLNSDNIGTTAISYSSWIYINGAGENDEGRILDNGKFIIFLLGGDTTKINFTSDGGVNTAVSATSSTAVNTWYHLVITRTSAGVANIYINGILSGTADQTSGTPVVGTTNTCIGNNLAGTRTWDGQLRNIVIFNRVISTQEISDLYNNTTFNYMDNLVSKWDMSEINPQDYIGGNNGTGTSIVTADVTEGHNGSSRAINFDGANDYVSVPASASIANIFSGNQGGSIVFWCKCDSDGGGNNGRLIDKGGNGYFISTTNMSGLTLRYSLLTRFSTTPSAWVTDSNVGLINEWQHLTVSYTKGSITDDPEIFVNGITQGITETQAPVGTPLSDVAEAANIGGVATRYFDGKLSEVMFFNKKLTNMQAADLYARTR